jgi:NAD(P)H-hydrate epimerase
MPGAAILCARAAARAGAGLVTLAVFARETLVAVAAAAPETIFLDLSRAGLDPAALIRERAHDARVIGPGLGRSERARTLVRALVADAFEGPLVLDADGLNLIAPRPELCRERRGASVLTPHPGEAARLLGRAIPADERGRMESARELAVRAGAICVLKGKGTVISDGERVHVNTTGNPGMASGGTGDVLAGILGAYLAQAHLGATPDFGPWEAVLAAVHVHGLAGDLAARARGERGLIASDLIEHLPAAQRLHAEAGARE